MGKFVLKFVSSTTDKPEFYQLFNRLFTESSNLSTFQTLRFLLSRALNQFATCYVSIYFLLTRDLLNANKFRSASLIAPFQKNILNYKLCGWILYCRLRQCKCTVVCNCCSVRGDARSSCSQYQLSLIKLRFLSESEFHSNFRSSFLLDTNPERQLLILRGIV